MSSQWRPSDGGLGKGNRQRTDRLPVEVRDLWLKVTRKGPSAALPATPWKHRRRQREWPLSKTSHLHSPEACQLEAKAHELLTRAAGALRVNANLHRTVSKSQAGTPAPGLTDEMQGWPGPRSGGCPGSEGRSCPALPRVGAGPGAERGDRELRHRPFCLHLPEKGQLHLPHELSAEGKG